MGVGMQIVCVGFAGSAALEAEAGAQLVRLERFHARVDECRLAIESRATSDDDALYDVRLELLMNGRAVAPVPSCSGVDVNEAMGRAFAAAERVLSAGHADDPLSPALSAAETGTAAH
ncbi:hypothetical protein [Burkholderia vietnamiensis]|uniref:Metal ABC transporter ATPase n=1 Tax=Burkholderia vietnamiensis TaxID=60552 RepID=A0AAW7SV45_BURVI|nr:hypothetical protein [Burkholderia vietnamiensis]KKI37268.1 metal ABC transporter ATPase [Burkholderia vietnamiensis]MBR8004675.1 metal ABC transporter ATPase [Burkholderia vietnamiensis]MBR8147316.1 metal ABC transporter ATPase [Burkholderia vietnamiensis]MBR8227055.1 metal ABC transporter ATPase [Burkholderia vietnamiensis]MCA7942312.1 metal ABC transporter ATPase [Burkholderia vietnamiensis]